MFKIAIRPLILVSFCVIFTIFRACAQGAPDTLKVSIAQAEDLFLKNNLKIIIQRYNIDNAGAQLITARLFPNPDFSFNNGIHTNDVMQGPAFKDQSFSISQLFTTAGKRNKNIQLAKIGVDQAKYQFFDLLRTLKFTLRNDFYNIYFQEQSAKVYNDEISSLAKTLTVFKEQYIKGNVAEKEVLRIQSQLYTLQAEYNNLLVGIDTVQSEFKMLVKVSPDTYIQPVYNYDLDGKSIVEMVSYQAMLDSAYSNRYDLRLAKINVDYNNMNLQLQKAAAVPDFSLSVNYDKYGGYGTNFIGAGVEFNLPFFNRNQGNIKQARIAIDQSKVQLQSQQDQLQSDLATEYRGALRLEKLYNSFDPRFKQNFTHLIQEVFKNYEKRNIGLLEFLDFYDSYKTNTLQLNALELNRIVTLEQLNYVTGTPFFNN
ncbi:TolC family protein [Mucilaginibacter gotjawali]|uniref:Cobalt-zinc-cadmium efflux system outer membrane protein n=2 Tax=Mucilaginibacter gotjawali TaxID=1550579 RepID=A0A839SLE7_9SPHI|nr:TolC family protein [Mucilaginibacter gotjawali]MBB3058064.1 cobalt-zinc-cadmium efflux system outer membrane protein [Mucilaginibacter gotjawali]BAU52039.1 Outer membrane efflux protein [Mucilaginibacter gotjawali]